MLRQTGLAALVIGSALSSFLFVFRPAGTQGNSRNNHGSELDVEAVHRQSSRLSAELESYKRFSEIKLAILAALGRGETSLREACEQMQDASVMIFPTFLRRIEFLEGENSKDKLARNIVRYFQMERESEPTSSSAAERARELELELASASFQSWCRRPWRVASGDY